MTATFRRRKAESIDELLFSEVPENWLSLSLKRVVKPKVTDGPHETPELVSNGIPFASAEAVENGIINFERVRGFISYKQHKIYSKKCLPQRNDIFIVKSGSTTGKIGYVNTDIEFNIWSPLALVRANPKYCVPRFLYHALCSELFQIQVQVSWSYGTQPNIGMGVIENLRVFIPPIEQQKAIASFLDRKTAAIDTLIAKKQRLIQLLEEKRTALIKQAVTKGLNPNVPMKDSGIPWIGKIPKYWKILQIKRAFVLQRGVDITKEGQLEGDIPVVSSGGISSYHNVAFAKAPGVVIGRKGTLGKVYYLNQDYWPHDTTLWVSNFYGNYPRFIFYKLISMNLERWDTGSANPTLNRNLIHPIKMSCPPKKEQIEIASLLDSKSVAINQVVDRVKEQIEKLQEYRQSLITAAVTGKIDIREEVAA